MMVTREVQVAICDACKAEEVLEGGSDAFRVPEGWVGGEVTSTSNSGDFYACRTAHIKKAVMVAAGMEE